MQADVFSGVQGMLQSDRLAVDMMTMPPSWPHDDRPASHFLFADANDASADSAALVSACRCAHA